VLMYSYMFNIHCHHLAKRINGINKYMNELITEVGPITRLDKVHITVFSHSLHKKVLFLPPPTQFPYTVLISIILC
jgi:hypothetical protein